MEVDLNVRAELEWVIFVFIRNIDEKSTDDIMREISIETLRHIYKIHKRDSAITANYIAWCACTCADVELRACSVYTLLVAGRYINLSSLHVGVTVHRETMLHILTLRGHSGHRL